MAKVKTFKHVMTGARLRGHLIVTYTGQYSGWSVKYKGKILFLSASDWDML